MQAIASQRTAEPILLNQIIEAREGARVRVRGHWLLDFTSSNYLGLAQHPRVRDAMVSAAEKWGASLAVPRAVARAGYSHELETRLAHLTGADAALVFPSTLHAAIDVLTMLARDGMRLFVDERAYPISLTAARRASTTSRPLVRTRHDDPAALSRAVERCGRNTRPVVICDGVYPDTGRPALLRQIASVTRDHHGLVVMDDTQGVGLLGRQPTQLMPYGSGGGGSMVHTSSSGEGVVVIASLSKALGVPVAVVAGQGEVIARLMAQSSAFFHNSQPTPPVLAAALTALEVSANEGDQLRANLLTLVRQFRAGLANLKLPLLTATEFPVQARGMTDPETARQVGIALVQDGVWPVATRARDPDYRAALTFVFTALHTERDIERALTALDRAIIGSAPRLYALR